MKLCASNIAWSNLDDNEMLDYLLKNNFEGLEIAPTRLVEYPAYDKIDEAKKIMQNIKLKYNLKICSAQSIWFNVDKKLFTNKEDDEYLINYTKKAIDFCKSLGIQNIVFGCPKQRQINKPEDLILAKSIFTTLAKYAAANNTVLALEPNPTIYNTNFINTTNEALNFVKEINCPGLKVNYDLGTVIYNNENLISAEELQFVNHIHISQPYLAPIEKNVIFENLLQLLVKNNYTNYVSIEQKNTGKLSDIKQSINYIKELKEKYEGIR